MRHRDCLLLARAGGGSGGDGRGLQELVLLFGGLQGVAGRGRQLRGLARAHLWGGGTVSLTIINIIIFVIAPIGH